MLDAILQQVAGHGLGGLASRVGLTPEQVQMALAALGQNAPIPGDTAHQAATQTGLPVHALQQILAQVGGEGGLGQIAGALGGSTAGAAGGAGGLGDLLGGLMGGRR